MEKAEDSRKPSTTSSTKDNGEAVADPGPPDGGQYVSGFKLGMLVMGIVLACFLMLLDTSVVSTAIPKITDEFHSLSDVGWYGSAYSLGSAALQPLTGRIYHAFPLKISWLCFFVIFELGSVLCGAAQSSTMFIVGRAIAGIGASGLLSGAINIISSSVPLERRPSLIGMMMGIANLGTVLGPVIGGAFTTGYTWRWSFYINLPLGAIVAVPLLITKVPEQFHKEPVSKVLPRIHHVLDLVGFALFAPSVIMLLLALQYGAGGEHSWHSATVIGLFCGAGASFIVFLAWDLYKKDEALIPFSLVRRRTVWASALNYSFMMATMFGVSYFLPIYFQAVRNMSAIISGVNLLPTILPQLVFAIGSGVAVTKIGFIPPFSLFSGMLISIATGLFSTLRVDTSLGKRVGFQIIMGVGLGSGLQMPIVAVQNSMQQKEMATAMAFLVWSQYMGPTVFLTLYNVIFDTSLKYALAQDAPNVNAAAVVAAGATGFREVVDPGDLPGVLLAYASSIDKVFYLATSAGAVAFIGASLMGWNDIRKKPVASAATVAAPSNPGELEPGTENATASIDTQKTSHVV
ncbi:major facilitator superfamily domain-containing protein [Coniella lustricola]|uniref:Major facilitator superfamily domain-containing protein n=1 Tax=Coniella lustricola TaxID=2025994 RepID=A0A2T3A252_9PEZI|nr:major facilitator superfamily domain-containing protein [Coniella lustricola]